MLQNPTMRLVGICAALTLAMVAVALVAQPGRGDAHAQFYDAVLALGLTDQKHDQLRTELHQAILAMEREPCDDGLRQVAGQTAVAYYETLLEKPLTKSGVGINQRGVCSLKATTGLISPPQSLTLVQSFRNGSRLPWDCLPAKWQTPSDLAIQTKLEADIREAKLTTDALSGTLGLLAKAWETSPQASRCQSQQADIRNVVPDAQPLRPRFGSEVAPPNHR